MTAHLPYTWLRALGWVKGADDSSLGSAASMEANAQLLHEMFQVVLLREPSHAEYAGYLNVLGQGATLEGLYNGFTHSSDYRALESRHRGARHEALKAFAEELALIEAELPQATEFNAASAEPLAMPVQPTGEEGGAAPSALNFNGSAVGVCSPDEAVPGEPNCAAPAAKTPVEVAALASSYEAIFRHASFFTLKRVLGDEALKLVAVKQFQRKGHETPSPLARWYGAWAARIAGRGIDFGLPMRNKADPIFHEKWADSSSGDRLRWEVLNRLHRLIDVLNQKGRSS